MRRSSIISILALLLPAFVIGSCPASEIKIAGSTVLLPAAQTWAKSFPDKHPGQQVSVSGGGSAIGIKMLIEGKCDIALSSRQASVTERMAARKRNIVLHRVDVAAEALAVVVHPSNHATGLSVAQLARIYSGDLKRWDRVGGAKGPIHPIGQDTGSVAYGFFDQVVMHGRPRSKTIAVWDPSRSVSSPDMISLDKGAIAYCSPSLAGALAETGRAAIIPISDGKHTPAMWSPANIVTGNYPLSRVLCFYTRGKPAGTVKSFIDWCRKPENDGPLLREFIYPCRPMD